MEKILIDAFCSIGINLTPKQTERFICYYNLLLEWNNKINLTTILDWEDVVKKHFADSMTASKYIQKNQTLIDVGSGAGFPGIPLKIYDESLDVTLLDSLNKRVIFLNEVIGSLNLKKIKAIHSRAESAAGNEEFRQAYDVVCSRAVAKLNVLAEYCLPLLKTGGIFIAYKTKDDVELSSAKNAIRILGGEVEKIDEFNLFDFKRKLIIIKKIKSTPPEFPRDAGKIKSKPL